MKVEDFLNSQVRDYSIEILKNRAIPHIIDGFKPSARKVVFTAHKTAQSLIKTSALVGKTIDVGGYDKGEGSIPGVINGLTQDFIGSNNIPFLEGKGNFGSRSLPNSSAAARYTSIKIHKNFKELFIDNELLEYDDEYEPKYFLPIIPTILLNPRQGIAVGFACEFQPYDIKDIIKNVKKVINNKKQSTILPFYKDFKGTIHKIGDKIFMDGIITKKSTLTYEISEIPVGISREQYIDHLDLLIEGTKKKAPSIKSYSEKSGKGFNFEIIISREQAITLENYNEGQLLKEFKLRKTLNENLNAINEFNNLLQFNNINEIIEYFVKFRLTIYTERKLFQIKKSTEKIDELQEKKRFIQSVISGKIILKGFKSKKEVLKHISIKGFKKAELLSNIPIYNLTQEKVDEYSLKIPEYEKERDYYKKTSEVDLYLKDLK